MTTTPTTGVVNVTPSQAAEWLKHNSHNRALRENKVNGFARDMENGAWVFNGDAIRFAVDGTLLDGQHRLTAITRSEVTVPCLVVWGLPSEAQETMDIGSRRMVRDQLHLRGESNSSELAAIARRSVMAERGTVEGGSSTYVPTNAEVFAYIEANPGLRRAAEVAVQAKGKLPCAPSAIGSAYFMCARRNEANAETFYIDRVINGLGLRHDDPAYVLRQRIQRDWTTTGRQMANNDVYRYCILAWNHYRSGNSLSKLQAPKGGWAAAPMPQPK